jgi:HAE1 family hydrophobic/amphiphilic exporter-1
LDLTSLTNLPVSFPIELSLPGTEPLTSFPLTVGRDGKEVSHMGAFFDSDFTASRNVLFRRDGQNYLPLYFRLGGITIGQAVSQLETEATHLKVDPKSLVPMGAIETMNETFSNALLLSSLLIFLILVAQFQSVAQACIIMYSIPLAVGGAIGGLLIFGETLNVGVIVGFILLIGIVVNNGILLFEAINQRCDAGMAITEAVVDAVDSRTRPILISTFSTVFGMVPTLVFESEGQELYRGMAVVNVFGMLFGTFLTLVVTPVVVRTYLEYQRRKLTDKGGTDVRTHGAV